MNSYLSGWAGEIKAAAYLKKKGWRILERRYRTVHGEIDIIAKDGETTVFVEVKYRPEGRMNSGFEAINAPKQKLCRNAAGHYLQTHPSRDYRFDALEITGAGIRHIPNAF